MGTDPEHADPDEVRRQVQHILDSTTFRNAGRLSRFLDYITTQALSGASEDIKEYAIGVEVFQRGAAFDPRNDSVVRVEARRLRAKLRDYYDSEGAGDPISISIPKGSYVPAFRRRRSPVPPRGGLVRRWIPWAAAVCGVALLVWFLPRIGYPTAGRTAVVAVLPLENLSADPANDYFCHALADEAASRLQHLASVRVVTRGPGGPFMARAELGSVARDQKARYALEGSASFSPGRVHVTVALVELNGFINVWQESYDRPAEDRLAVQSELAAAVARSAEPFLR